MPSAPSRMAASKLASVFSGKRDDAWDKLSMLPSSGSHTVENKESCMYSDGKRRCGEEWHIVTTLTPR
jgi:hypothetical protein